MYVTLGVLIFLNQRYLVFNMMCLICCGWWVVLCRVKRVTKMTEKVATGVLSGVVKVSGFFTGSVANSKVGKKFFGLLPGEIVIASLDGFSMSKHPYLYTFCFLAVFVSRRDW